METRLTLYSGSVPDPDSLKNLLSPVRKRSIMLAGHKTSVSLETNFGMDYTKLRRATVLRHRRSSSGSTPIAPFTIFHRPSGCSYWIISGLALRRPQDRKVGLMPAFAREELLGHVPVLMVLPVPPSHPPIPAVRICRWCSGGLPGRAAAFLFKSVGLLKPQPIPGG
jgi:hypothetical protein